MNQNTSLIDELKAAQHSIGKDETNGLISYRAWEIIHDAIQAKIEELQAEVDDEIRN